MILVYELYCYFLSVHNWFLYGNSKKYKFIMIFKGILGEIMVYFIQSITLPITFYEDDIEHKFDS